MNCLPPPKRKRKKKCLPVELKKINKRWNSCDIDAEVVFNNGTNVDGFLELEEIHDYDEDEINAIVNLSKKKKKVINSDQDNDENNAIVNLSKKKKKVVNSNQVEDGINAIENLSKKKKKVVNSNQVEDGINAIVNLSKKKKKMITSNESDNENKESNVNMKSNVILDADLILHDVDLIDDVNLISDVNLNDDTDGKTEYLCKQNKIIKLDENLLNDVEDKTSQSSKEGDVPTKILTKKERRKQARKSSFKLKLKERRKKYKEMKRAKAMDQVPIDEICNRVIDKCESFEMKSSVRSKMKEWLGLGVPDKVMKALSDSNFTTPTPIQRECLPQAIFYKQDIIGAAETGSGKTLAFGIPLIKNIMELKQKESKEEDENDEKEDTPLYALIITPTRELAIQIKDHIETAAKYADLQCVAIVGGLSTAKQERLLGKCPEIIVGTPGRLHKLFMEGNEHLNKFETLKFLVIDEADRMLEHGHFKELNDIFDMMNRVKVKRQIFVFSATLTLPQHHKKHEKKGKKEKEKKPDDSGMQIFIDKIGLNQKAKVIDLTPHHVTASHLQQLRVMCADEEKEIYLMYFLMLHPGRSIVFVNSISYTRRLCSLLNLLGFNPLQLHSGKQQRQRLTYLERFTASEKGLLIATDVAARGLDIPKVSNVIHFQLPNNPKVYIHRAGRTARANESGLSFILEGPEDFSALKKISAVLKLDKDIPSLKVDRKILDGIKTRVLLAREIDRDEYKLRKENADNSWLSRTAKSMDIETDEMEKTVLTKQEKLQRSVKRKELQKLLSEDLYPSGFSSCYPTQSGSLLVPSLNMERKQ